MKPIVIIPARMAATRLPGKPLADIEGLPMIVRVLRQAQAAGVGPVAVAAGDAEIVEAVTAAGGVLHSVIGKEDDTLDGLAANFGLTADDIVTAVTIARAFGFSIDPAFKRVCP